LKRRSLLSKIERRSTSSGEKRGEYDLSSLMMKGALMKFNFVFSKIDKKTLFKAIMKSLYRIEI